MNFYRFYIWIKRCCYCRGFGIQSPTDYRFVRYVINEHYPYYAYSDIKKLNGKFGWLSHKLGKLYFRIINYCQPNTVVNLLPDNELYDIYLRRGSSFANILHDISEGNNADLLLLAGDCGINKNVVFSIIHNNSILIIEGINNNDNARMFWKNIKYDNRVTISFDLYYVGIAMFDEKRYKQCYKINF